VLSYRCYDGSIRNFSGNRNETRDQDGAQSTRESFFLFVESYWTGGGRRDWSIHFLSRPYVFTALIYTKSVRFIDYPRNTSNTGNRRLEIEFPLPSSLAPVIMGDCKFRVTSRRTVTVIDLYFIHSKTTPLKRDITSLICISEP